ncbi:MAG: hypothetical protein QXL67_04010, partial [Candidatus Bathyarchaeia archaeon]
LRTLEARRERDKKLCEETHKPLTLQEVEKTLNVPTITTIKIIEKLINDGKVEEFQHQPMYW